MTPHLLNTPPASDTVAAALAAAAQEDLSGSLNRVYFTMIGTAAAIFGAVIFLMLLRKIMRSRAPRGALPGLDLGSVEDMRRKGLVSEEEARRIRGVVVKQTLQREELKAASGEGGGSLDLAVALALADKPAAPPRPSRTPAEPAAAAPTPASGTGAPKAKPLDLDQLLERGLITREEYDRLTRLFRRSQQ